MKYEFTNRILPSLLFPLVRLSFSLEDACLCKAHARARSSASLATPLACGRTRDAYREVTCGRTVSRLCAQLYVRIRMEIRKEAGHEQWLAALRNNVVFVGSFYLPRQECTVRFKIHAQLRVAQSDRTDHSSCSASA